MATCRGPHFTHFIGVAECTVCGAWVAFKRPVDDAKFIDAMLDDKARVSCPVCKGSADELFMGAWTEGAKS